MSWMLLLLITNIPYIPNSIYIITISFLLNTAPKFASFHCDILIYASSWYSSLRNMLLLLRVLAAFRYLSECNVADISVCVTEIFSNCGSFGFIFMCGRGLLLSPSFVGDWKKLLRWFALSMFEVYIFKYWYFWSIWARFYELFQY